MSLNNGSEAINPPCLQEMLVADAGIPRLLESPEALDDYLVDVRRRREAHREQRRRAYWMSAVARLGEELEAAEQEQDAVIAAELQVVIRSFQDALDASGPDAASPRASDTAQFPTPVPDAPCPTVAGHELPPAPPQAFVPPRDQALPDDTPPAEIIQAGYGGPEAYAPTSGEADGNGSEQQRLEEAREALAEKAEHLEARIATHLETNGRSLANAIRTRALFCDGQALILHADTPIQEPQPLRGLLTKLATGTPWAANARPLSGPMYSQRTWAELSELYDACAVAAEAMEWFEDNEEHLAEHARVDLLNAISAAQQRLYRRPESLVRIDDAVQELYRSVREAGQRTAFIRALSRHVADEELPALAGRCAQIFHELRDEVEEQKAQAGRAKRKEDAVAAVIAWEEALEGRGVTLETLAKDRERLCALLDECLTAGVPATNVKVRSAILDTAPVLLDGETRYARFLEAVLTERSRRKLDAVEVAEAHADVGDEDLDALVGSVLEFTRGKRVMMLGGKSRPQVSQELARRLECDVTWSDSDRGDKFAKFASSVKKADAVLLLKNFASHEIFYGSKDAMAGEGKHFVVLPSGYGVKQVIYQLSQYIGRENVGAF